MRATVPALLLAVLLAGCGGGDGEPGSGPDPSPGGGTSSGRSPSAGTTTPATSPSPTGAASTADGPTDSDPPRPRKERVRHIGIDASHHQGAIDWEAVADDGISFAYLKASEGTTFTDPMYAANARAAHDLGIEVSGYHYFSLCTPGAAQADHFVSVLGATPRGWLPPAVDVELLGSCSTPPPRDQLLAEIRAFLERVERHTGQEPVVYLFPDFEEEYGAAADLAGYRHWVRDLDSRPGREWWIWQRTDSGTVAGVDGPVDVNVLVRRERPPR